MWRNGAKPPFRKATSRSDTNCVSGVQGRSPGFFLRFWKSTVNRKMESLSGFFCKKCNIFANFGGKLNSRCASSVGFQSVKFVSILLTPDPLPLHPLLRGPGGLPPPPGKNRVFLWSLPRYVIIIMVSSKICELKCVSTSGVSKSNFGSGDFTTEICIKQLNVGQNSPKSTIIDFS